MRVEIDDFGNMTICPCEGEGYMLRKWWEDWQAHRACLSIGIVYGHGIRAETRVIPTTGNDGAGHG